MSNQPENHEDQHANEIKNNGSLHNYRTEIPNIIEELGLCPFEYRLYCHYKKVAGDRGSCFETNAKTAEICNMSVTSVKEKRKSLALPRDKIGGKSLIIVTERKRKDGNHAPTLIEIVDIWPDNFKIIYTRSPNDRGGSPNGHRRRTNEEDPKEEQQQVAVFQILENLEITDSDKKWISANYKQEEVENAVSFVTSSNFVIKTTLSQAIKWACKEKPIPSLTPEQKIRENKKTATAIFKSINSKPKTASVYFFNTYVEICDSQNINNLIINIDDAEFEKKFTQGLMKWGFKF